MAISDFDAKYPWRPYVDSAFISIQRTDHLGGSLPELKFQRNYFSSPATKTGVLIDTRDSIFQRPGLVTVGLAPDGQVTRVAVEGAFVMPLHDAVVSGVVTLVDAGFCTTRLRRGWRGFWRMVARASLYLARLS